MPWSQGYFIMFRLHFTNTWWSKLKITLSRLNYTSRAHLDNFCRSGALGSSAPPPQFTKLWKWWQNEATLPRKWVRYQHNFCTSSRTQRRRERGFHPFPCYQSCPRVKVVIWKRKIEEEGLLSPWWISPVIPSLRDYNAIQITVGIDDPCISTPSSSQVYDPRTIQSTIEERKPCVIWWRVPLRSSNCSITSCSGMKCTSLLQDTHF